MNMNPPRTSFGTGYAQERAIPEFIRRVFLWMSAGLAITGFVAYGVASLAANGSFPISRPLFIVLILVELGLVVAISAAINRISAATAAGLFLLYSAVNGVTLSVIFFAYTLHSIGQVFFITAGTFGAFALYGYITKRDLTSMGQLFFMGLIGIVIASVVNIFLHSDALAWAISVVGVVVFCGLTAYDMQKLRSYALEAGYDLGNEAVRKVSIVGALMLYLDFINLFLMLLRLFGDRRR
jgi:FtsH-binding integral membrane protein